MSIIDFPTGEAALQRAGQLAQLRELLAEKFQEPAIRPSDVLPTGLAPMDAREGGLRKGALTEIVGASSAGGLFIEAMLGALASQGYYAALVDAGRSFDPQDAENSALQRLLWVLCENPKQAVKAADLLLRDGNLALILLDFHTVPRREIQRLPASTWHRFQRIVEQTSTALVVLASQPVVEGARVRIAIRDRWKLDSMHERRCALLQRLDVQVFVRAEFSSGGPLQQKNG